MRTAAIVQARMDSVRLPGKILKDLCGKPLLWHIVKRLERCRNLDDIVIATSVDKADDVIVDLCKKYKIRYYRGNLGNVLERFVKAMDEYSMEYVVRVTGDTPFPFPMYIDEKVAAIKRFEGDVVVCENPGCLFGGQGVYSSNVLRNAYLSSHNPLDLEHVGALYVAQNLKKLKVVKVVLPCELIVPNVRLTIDTIEDYTLISKIYSDLYREGSLIDVFMLREWLKSNKNLLRMNLGIKMEPSYYELSEISKNNILEANVVGTHKIDLIRWSKNEYSWLD